MQDYILSWNQCRIPSFQDISARFLPLPISVPDSFLSCYQCQIPFCPGVSSHLFSHHSIHASIPPYLSRTMGTLEPTPWVYVLAGESATCFCSNVCGGCSRDQEAVLQWSMFPIISWQANINMNGANNCALEYRVGGLCCQGDLWEALSDKSDWCGVRCVCSIQPAQP